EAPTQRVEELLGVRHGRLVRPTVDAKGARRRAHASFPPRRLGGFRALRMALSVRTRTSTRRYPSVARLSDSNGAVRAATSPADRIASAVGTASPRTASAGRARQGVGETPPI